MYYVRYYHAHAWHRSCLLAKRPAHRLGATLRRLGYHATVYAFRTI